MVTYNDNLFKILKSDKIENRLDAANEISKDVIFVRDKDGKIITQRTNYESIRNLEKFLRQFREKIK